MTLGFLFLGQTTLTANYVLKALFTFQYLSFISEYDMFVGVMEYT